MAFTDQLARLAAIEPSPYPVVSLYLNAQSNERGRDSYQAFVRKELKARAATYPPRSSEREMLDRDCEHIASFLATGVEPSSNGIAIFAGDPMNLFDTVQFETPSEA